MKRYHLDCIHKDTSDCPGFMNRYPDGEWVRYEDAIWMIRSLMDDVKRERKECAEIALNMAELKGNCDAHFEMADWIAAICARGEK